MLYVIFLQNLNPYETDLNAGQMIPFHLIAPFIAGSVVLGIVLLWGAVLTAVLYLFQSHALKDKRILELSPIIPAIEVLDHIFVISLWAGVLCLGFGVWSSLFVASPSLRFLWSLLLWLWYTYVLWTRLKKQKPKESALRGLLGVFLLFPTFFGLGFGLGL